MFNSLYKMINIHFVVTLLLFLPFPIVLGANNEDQQKNSKNKASSTTMASNFNNGMFRGKPCNSSNLEECWASENLNVEPKIPTSSREVTIVCRAFNSGMSCVDEFTKQCLTLKQRQQLKNSVRGAHTIFSFLCQDAKFQAEFLSHAPCYQRISRSWDVCAAHFIASLKKADQKDSLAVCCIRLRFLQCVTELARLHCSKDAESFLQRLATELVTTNMNRNASECSAVSTAKCSQSSGASTPTTAISFSLKSPSLKMLSFFTKMFSQHWEKMNHWICSSFLWLGQK